MRIEDIYFERSVKVSKKDKDTRPCIDNKIGVPDSKAISNMLNLVDKFIPFFRRE